ncbi:MAG: hypothetical protein AAFO07_16570 [Bacteroidota bacterium]
MNKKVLFLLVAATLSFTVIANAQNQGNRNGRQGQPKITEEMRAERIENLTTQLALNESQKATLINLEAEMHESMTALMENGQTNRNAMRKEMKALQDKMTTGMKEVLSEEQFEKYQAIMKEEQKKRRPPRQGQR